MIAIPRNNEAINGDVVIGVVGYCKHRIANITTFADEDRNVCKWSRMCLFVCFCVPHIYVSVYNRINLWQSTALTMRTNDANANEWKIVSTFVNGLFKSTKKVRCRRVFGSKLLNGDRRVSVQKSLDTVWSTYHLSFQCEWYRSESSISRGKSPSSPVCRLMYCEWCTQPRRDITAQSGVWVLLKITICRSFNT